jgi:hypothetical protein
MRLPSGLRSARHADSSIAGTGEREDDEEELVEETAGSVLA